MAEVTMKPEWTINLSTQELRLILKALGGRLKPDEVEEARHLGNDLSKRRASMTISIMQAATKLLDNLD